ncbi:hypothetical protein H5410_054793 [Solanum commersonii]|uniref:Uncharacterized protein n=1 Tax=Solanum commersonii TaxID=4109 RepID=A0A9J5WFV8_SOLCO|nr:hypothetical protein H5410_054793 [Solanum commersonii]
MTTKSQFGTQRFNRYPEAKKNTLQCSHCKKPGHSADKCYRIIGFPAYFKFTKSKRLRFARFVDIFASTKASQSTSQKHITQEQYNNICHLLQHFKFESPEELSSEVTVTANCAAKWDGYELERNLLRRTSDHNDPNEVNQGEHGQKPNENLDFIHFDLEKTTLNAYGRWERRQRSSASFNADGCHLVAAARFWVLAFSWKKKKKNKGYRGGVGQWVYVWIMGWVGEFAGLLYAVGDVCWNVCITRMVGCWYCISGGPRNVGLLEFG